MRWVREQGACPEHRPLDDDDGRSDDPPTDEVLRPPAVGEPKAKRKPGKRFRPGAEAEEDIVTQDKIIRDLEEELKREWTKNVPDAILILMAAGAYAAMGSGIAKAAEALSMTEKSLTRNYGKHNMMKRGPRATARAGYVENWTEIMLGFEGLKSGQRRRRKDWLDGSGGFSQEPLEDPDVGGPVGGPVEAPVSFGQWWFAQQIVEPGFSGWGWVMGPEEVDPNTFEFEGSWIFETSDPGPAGALSVPVSTLPQAGLFS